MRESRVNWLLMRRERGDGGARKPNRSAKATQKKKNAAHVGPSQDVHLGDNFMKHKM